MSKCTPEMFPTKEIRKIGGRIRPRTMELLVGAHGLEPWTSSLSETRSNQLSYAPKKCHDARKRRGGIPFSSVSVGFLQQQNSVIQRA